MDNILITGFEKFGEYKENVTETLSKKIPNLPNYSLKYMIFSVRVFSNGAENYGKQIIAKAQEINAKAIISLGMASDVRGLRIESQATNWVRNEKYCIPLEQNRVIDSNLNPKHILRINLGKWNMEKIFSAFQEMNIIHESEISTNASTFCCNALMFRTLQAIQVAKCSIPYIYLHVPCSRQAVEGISNFDKEKCLISTYDIEDMLAVLAICYI